MFDVIVIGGGPAGVTASLRARELGAAVALVERDRLGGTCTNDSCVPTRVLAHAARLVRDAQQFGDYGLEGAQPTVDLGHLLARTQRVVYKIHEKKQLLKHFEESGATVYENVGEGRFADEHTITLADGTRLQGDKFILCAGGHPNRLKFPGAEYALTYSDVWALKALPRAVVVVGGAATGCQLASNLAAFGSHVWLLEISQRILRAEDESISQALHENFTKRGIQVVTGIEGVERIEKTDRMLEFRYAHDGQTHTLEADAVIVAAGWPGNVEALNLSAANVKTERGYILVDDFFRTTAPHIFAAGDITGRMMLVQSAGYEARIAAENAVLGVGQPYKHLIVPHGNFTDPEYASVGMTETQARAQHDCAAAVVPYTDLDRAVIDGHTEGLCKLIVSRETHRLLGAHVVGEQATEIIQLAAACMAADMWVEQLAEVELAYPTYTAIVGLAARRLVRELGVMPLAPQWRALGKPHAEWERSDA